MIAYTLETKGLLTNSHNPTNSWSSDITMLRAMQLSAHMASKKERPTIIADYVGCELIDRLQIDCDLRETSFPDYPRDMFGLSKLWGFAQLDAPFIHLDFDLFVRNWDALPAGWAVYCKEPLFEGNPYNVIRECAALGVKGIEVWESAFDCVYNMGLYSCADHEVNMEHTDLVFRFARENREVLNSLPYMTRAKLNIAVDQLTLTGLLNERNITPHVTQHHTQVSNSYDIVHLMGATKSYLDNEVWINGLHGEANLPDVFDALEYWAARKEEV